MRGRSSVIVRELLWAPSGDRDLLRAFRQFCLESLAARHGREHSQSGFTRQLTAGAGQDTAWLSRATAKKPRSRSRQRRSGSGPTVLTPRRVRSLARRAGDRPHDGRARDGCARARRPPTRLCHHGRRDGKVGVVDHRSVTGSSGCCPATIIIARPQWSRDSRRLAYHWESGGSSPLWAAGEPSLSGSPGGDETLLSTPKQQIRAAARMVSRRKLHPCDWYSTRAQGMVTLWPVAAAPHADTAATLVTADPKRELWQARFSPNGRWISFLALTASTAVVCVVPSSARNARAADWTCLTDPRIWTDKPRWSSDGKLLYVWRRHGAFYQRLGAALRRCAGHRRGRSVPNHALRQPRSPHLG